MEFADLVRRARSLVRGDGRAILGITGSPGAGKSTLAEALLHALSTTPPPGQPAGDWVAHVPMDGFHLADVELDRLARRSRKGAPDTFDAAGYAALLERVLRDEDEIVYAPGFERTIEQPIAGAIPIHPQARLIITEGNYLLLDDGAWGKVHSHLSETWYCDLSEEERVRRLVDRHKRFGKDHDAAVAWAGGTDQANAELIVATRPLADLVVPDVVFRGIGTEA